MKLSSSNLLIDKWFLINCKNRVVNYYDSIFDLRMEDCNIE